MSTSYLVELLSTAKPRREGFSCEEPELAEFLHHRALPEMEARASACFVLVPEDDPGRVAGFYTLSAATISLAKLPRELTTELPKYPNLPATLLGWLARDQKLDPRLTHWQTGWYELPTTIHHHGGPAGAGGKPRSHPMKSALLVLGAALLLSAPGSSVFAANATVSPKPIRGEVIINRTTSAWESQQVQEPCILSNPKDPTRLVMFYSGVPATNRNVCFIGKAWALKSDPFTWHQDEHNPVFSPGKQGWDSGSIRLDTVLYLAVEDAYYIYYSGTTASVQDRIGLAICPVGADGYSGITPAAIRRVGVQPVLAPEPAAPYFEEMASQAAVLREWDAEMQRWNWFMYYSYRGKDGILPGLRLATSRDGKVWTRHYNEKDPRGMGQIFKSTPGAYYEWHQVSRIGGTYVLAIEVGISAGKRWRPVIAVSQHPATGWAQTDVDALLQTKWEGLYREDTIYHVATPALYQIAGKWYLYAQACPLPENGNYIDGHWDLWCIACDRRIPTLPGREGIDIPGQPTAAEAVR